MGTFNEEPKWAAAKVFSLVFLGVTAMNSTAV
jgi:hypothetical protein